ncbi:hypothetical protein GCM10010399_42790 [Dactylosporangium fulvum]|uniref:Uncharacterized protein n=1 Tax=Dactylosporangium fulvum TaxID=53359 RepID=A0ABY5WE52_9ACTN|nr:hypothetical protein [Dactylosporangium fulvum]UWP87266.1 hypothetical protein Dfulv_00625 [Dactylosporangium fulvum]
MNKRIGGAVLAVAAAAIFAAACGLSDDTAPAAGPGASGGTDYASCLRNNGVDLPQMNPSNRPSGRPSGFPTARPSGEPRPSGGGGFRGGGPGGGGFFGTAAPNGVDQQTWEKAQKACESLRPTAFPGNGGGANGGGRDAAFRNCLSEHGVTVSGPVDQLDSSDAKVAAALTACAPLRPSARPSTS